MKIVDRRYRQPAEDRFWSKVRKTESCWEWTATKRRGYGLFWQHGKHVSAHRLAWLLSGEPLTDGEMLDHICFNRSCVRPQHLRLVTNKQNQEHRSGPTMLSTSRVLGVSRNGSSWKAEVRHNGKRYYFGTFRSLDAAAQAVRDGRNALYTHNDPDRVTPAERARWALDDELEAKAIARAAEWDHLDDCD